MSAPSILSPYGYSSGTCGYCSPSGVRSSKKESSKYGMISKQMTTEFYQVLMDRGWRRSGTYVYHPDMARTCCPQYTIRLDALNFKPNKKQKQVVNRFNRFLSEGAKPGESIVVDGPGAAGKGAQTGKSGGNKKGKGKANGGQRDLIAELHEYEVGYGNESQAVHRFETELVPAEATAERFELYKEYQIAIHKDKPAEVEMRGFDRFLCSGPLIAAPIPYKDREASARGIKEKRLPKDYGAHHLLYKVDSQVIAISVIDITPSGVSSVYFIWSPSWAWASLGTLSALYEVSLAQRIRRAEGDGGKMGWVYMGYWVPDCQKMKYKSEFGPSFLLDPGTNVFHPLSTKLEKYLVDHPRGYRPFIDIRKEAEGVEDHDASSALPNPKDDHEPGTNKDEDSDEEEDPVDFPSPPPPSFADPAAFSKEELDQVLVLLSMKGRQLFTISDLEFVDPTHMLDTVRQFMAALGKEWVAGAEDRARGTALKKAIMYLGY
ncbi:hypothetical protein L202_03607 [Cryptococcus amylolentus CBS 6039]|uniref:arginyltransferase n=2 Tax=Cryptococcus amylolentus TaxID=104669 RepID=A0A1E3HVB2_9TREE|nr:hypothetical protein L202_03607 [Cryptococcus amylolentus CBS 6039]ODN79676.1 hypothetical protein L202_03607 [Cryptococcus amylolentus CBS 6039]ODO07983.1 hypothetical protein I350_03566 [Cryptococcus amylolentus CBS 6273]